MSSTLEHGFAVVEELLSQAECDELAAQVSALGKRSAGSRCLLDESWCQEAAQHVREQLATDWGAVCKLSVVQCTYFHKTPETNWFVAWHQDRSIPVAAQEYNSELTGWSRKEGMLFVHAPDDVLAKMLAVRVHLDDSTRDNGPLRVIPNSHLGGTLSAEEIVSVREQETEQVCTVARGGALLMRPLLLHASSKSSTTEPRRVLHFLLGPHNLPYNLQWRRTIT